MRKYAIAAVVIVAILGVVIFLLPAQQGLSVAMTGQYANDDEVVGYTYGFASDGAPIDEIWVTLTWTVTGTNMDWTTLRLEIVFTVMAVAEEGRETRLTQTIDNRDGAEQVQGTDIWKWQLAGLGLDATNSYLEGEWKVRVYAEIDGTAYGEEDNSAWATWGPAFVDFYISYLDTSGTFTIGATLV